MSSIYLKTGLGFLRRLPDKSIIPEAEQKQLCANAAEISQIHDALKKYKLIKNFKWLLREGPDQYRFLPFGFGNTAEPERKSKESTVSFIKRLHTYQQKVIEKSPVLSKAIAYSKDFEEIWDAIDKKKRQNMKKVKKEWDARKPKKNSQKKKTSTKKKKKTSTEKKKKTSTKKKNTGKENTEKRTKKKTTKKKGTSLDAIVSDVFNHVENDKNTGTKKKKTQKQKAGQNKTGKKKTRDNRDKELRGMNHDDIKKLYNRYKKEGKKSWSSTSVAHKIRDILTYEYPND